MLWLFTRNNLRIREAVSGHVSTYTLLCTEYTVWSTPPSIMW